MLQLQFLKLAKQSNTSAEEYNQWEWMFLKDLITFLKGFMKNPLVAQFINAAAKINTLRKVEQLCLP